MKATDFLLNIPEIIGLQERAIYLANSEDMKLIKPYLRRGKPADLIKLDIDGEFSRSTFYRRLINVVQEGEYIRGKLIELCYGE